MTEQLRDEVAKVFAPEAWDQSVIEDAYYPVAKRRLEEMRKDAFEKADAAIAIVVERAAKMIETMQCYGESDVDAGYDSALREAADAVRALQEQNKESR